MTTKIYAPSGIKITVLSVHDDGEYFMVRSDTSGKVFFAHCDQVIDPVEDKSSEVDENRGLNRRNRRKVSSAPQEKKVLVQPVKPVDSRVNLNTLTAEGLTQVLPGVGIKTAKEIIELKQTLPGEKFIKLDQLKSVKRIDWDEVFATGEVFVE
jgi:DNA uptake protein ComE-like DNA-binding protein|tara:strand:+ start:100 stop:558 length:459 start_codon:yes stop_codon:yes gene_type:complete